MTVPTQSYLSKRRLFLFLFPLLAIVVFQFFTPRSLAFLGAVPPFSMVSVTAENRSVLTRDNLLGKPWIADFIFTNCQGPCPILTANMARLARELPVGINLVSFSVDPDNDTLAVLQSYAKRFGTGSERWYFARGEKRELRDLMLNGFKLSVAEDFQAITHSTKFVLVDARGNIRGYYDGESAADLNRIRKDALRLLKE